MKQCPECKEVYSDQLLYCMRDGQGLFDIGDDDDDEEPTVVRPQPVVVDIADEPGAVEPEEPEPIYIATPPTGRRINSVAVLIVGTLLGGILVLGTVVAVSILTRQKPAAPVNQVNIPPKPSNTPKPSPTETRSPVPTESPSPEDVEDTADLDDEQKRERWIKKGFNGRVIMINAVVRAAPSIDSEELAVIGYDEPVKIGKPAGENNPWYRVTTEDGVTGWMHGNTIEFIK